MRAPRATYRLQFRREFGFADAAAIPAVAVSSPCVSQSIVCEPPTRSDVRRPTHGSPQT